MPEFQDYYVFVDEVGGPNKSALQQWLAGYRVNQDIGRLIAIRVQNRFIHDSEGFPDRAYGRYFEHIIRAVSDSSYPEARRAEDYWILKRFPPQNNEGLEAGEYRFFILILITRGALEAKLRSLFLQYKTLGKPDRIQLAAINRISDTFFVNF